MGLYSAKWLIWNALVISLYPEARSLELRYHKNYELEGIMGSMSDKADQRIRTNLYSIGNSSYSGQPLRVMEITASEKGMIGVPNVKLIGNMHGNEAGARLVLLQFIELLIESYGKNETITWLLNNTRIHILPTLNPDGFERAGNACDISIGRGVPYGAAEIDLNRNFPDCFRVVKELEKRIEQSGKKYPNCKNNAYGLTNEKMTKETEAVIHWMEDYKFVLSAALHGGAWVANYPFDSNYSMNSTTKESPTPDDDVFKHLARTYSNSNPKLSSGSTCNNKSFKGGITNGAQWYAFEGGMGDYNYAFQGCMELTVEITCCKYPTTELDQLWLQNKESLLHFIMQANMGVAGQILDLHTEKPIEAILSIDGRQMKFQSFRKTGEFWRILLPGSYRLQVDAEGYFPENIEFSVSSNKSGYHQLTFLRINLTNSSFPTTPSNSKKLYDEYISRDIPSMESRKSSSIINCPKYLLLGLIYLIIIIL